MTNNDIGNEVAQTVQNDSTLVSIQETLTQLKETPVSEWLPRLVNDYVVPFAIKLVVAIIVLIIGRWIIKLVKKSIAKAMDRKKTEASLHSFLTSLTSVILNLILIIIIISILGINTSSLVALLASAGLAIGMALSGTLQNFAGGVMIMLFKPFKVGDFISAQGYEGNVKEIQIFNTIVTTLDHKVVTIPNGILSTGISVNYSKEETRRVDWTFSISYGDDYDKAKEVLLRLCQEDNRILTDPAVTVALIKLDTSSVNITLRAWVKSADYWPVFFEINQKAYKELPAAGLNLPYPQLDVHMKP